MKTRLWLFFFFLAALVVPALCQTSSAILTNESPDFTITSGSDEQVYGTEASHHITLQIGAKAELINFPGQNNIHIDSSSNLFTVSRSGTLVTFKSSDDETILKIPATTNVQTISFNGEQNKVLQIFDGRVMLDDQVVTETASSIDNITYYLTNESPDYIIITGRDEQVYGTASSNHITLQIGAKAELINFPGQNNIHIDSSSKDLFNVSRSGTLVTFEGPYDTILKIPATTDVQTISFNDEQSKVLLIKNGEVMLDDQVVTTTASSIDDVTYLIYLTITQPNHTIESGCDELVYGTSGSNTITLESGARAELINFPGQNQIVIESGLDGFKVFRSGTVVTFFKDSDETILKIPATKDEQTFTFNNEQSKALLINNGEVMLDDQKVTTTASSIEGPTCTYSFSPSSLSFTSDSESKSVTVEAPDSCILSISSSLDWVTLSRTGNTVTVTVDANTGEAPREGSVTIANEAYSISQEADSSCTYSISPSADNFTSDSESKSVTVTAPDSCTWETLNTLDWVTLSRTGNTVTVTVDANTGEAPREGSVTIANEAYSISQEADSSCTYSISPSADNFTSDSESKSVTVTAPDSCTWETLNTLDWVTLSRTGNTVTVTVDANPGDARNGSITIAGETYSINQQAAPSPSCTYSISPSAGNFTSDSESKSVTVTAPDSCTWDILNSLYWVTLSRTGNTVTVTVGANTGDARYGSVKIADKTYFINQEAAPASSCTYSISSSADNFTSDSESKSVTVTAPDSCIWGTLNSLDWVTLSRTGNTVTVTVDANTGDARNGSITIAGETYSINQEAAGQCGAYVATGVWKEFDCYNLAAIGKDEEADPFTPSWKLIGGYWQWGRKGPGSGEWYDTNTDNFAHGPTGPGATEANDGGSDSWDRTYADDNSWSDGSKTSNDPCPSGYRVPTKTQWRGVTLNNDQSTVGTWNSGDTSYGSARFFGEKLMLPAAGFRRETIGSLGLRGYFGHYWAATQCSSDTAWNLNFSEIAATTSNCEFRGQGFSVRCVAEE